MEYKGLSEAEAVDLIKKYGFNEIKEKKDGFAKKLLRKLINPITLMIEVAFALSLMAGKYEDSIIIFILFLVNLTVDLWQELKADKAIEALKKNLALKAYVLRDGKFKIIDARELVPGDIIKIGIGDIVPADIEILEDEVVQVDQSNLTGESLLAEKKKGDLLYASSIVHKGSFLAKVRKTGKDTFIGKSIKLVSKADKESKSHFELAILNIGKFLTGLAAVLIVLSSVYMSFKGYSLLDIVHFALVLSIASVPVALPAVLSVTLAIGAAALSKKRAIVSDPKALEELAGVSTLCVDKTGTLTKNEISVTNPKSYADFTLKDLFTFAYLCSEQEHKDSIDAAIERYVKENEFLPEAQEYILLEFESFDPKSKRALAKVKNKNGQELTIIKGAPQVVSVMLNAGQAKWLNDNVKELAKDGFRTLAVAVKKGSETQLVGIIPMFDPPRDDSRQLIKVLRSYGLNIKMLTGDNIAIARYIAKILDLGEDVISAFHFSRAKDKKSLIKHIEVFAEVLPEHKYQIVESLQKSGEFVAMTGDGVNDAPAIKKADIGIAVAGASDAARNAADLVLLDPGLSAIKTALEHARQIFARMQSYATFRIAETIRIVLFISLAIFVFGFAPLPAIMVVLLALLNDIPVMAIAYDNAAISKKPVRWDMKETMTVATVLGVSGVTASFLLLFVLVYYYRLPLETIYTLMFLKLDVSGHSTLYTTRTGDKHFWERPYPSLKFFLPAFGSRVLGTTMAYFGIFMSPISLGAIVAIWVYGTVWFIINDIIKVLLFKTLRKS